MSTKNDDIIPSGTAGFKPVVGFSVSPCSLSAEEVKLLKSALWAARRDIWQTLRVNEKNLTGIDPVFPDDEPCKPKVPALIHRAGLDESYDVHRQICKAQKMLASKANKHISPTASMPDFHK